MLFRFSATAPNPPAAKVDTMSVPTNAMIMTMACMKSDALSAKKPPRNVYATTNSAPNIIML